MLKYVVMVMLVALVATSAMAVNPIIHPTATLYEAYPGGSADNLAFAGSVLDGPTINAVPGVLSIIPQCYGKPAWSNYISAYTAKKEYTVKNVVLRKCDPPTLEGNQRYRPKTITQQGTPNIRLWWPLMYDVPGTTWTLTITYATKAAWVDPANTIASTVHQDVWQWTVGATLDSLLAALFLFHELPFGMSEVPIISDECLFPELIDSVFCIKELVANGKYADAGDELAMLDMEIADAAITSPPTLPNPCYGMGIANSVENPAVSKLLVDCEFIGFSLNIYQPSR